MSGPEPRTYVFDNRIPTLPEHRFLSDQVGWADSFRWSAMAASLAGSCCGTVVFTPSGHMVGMGRVVGDGAFFFYLQDIAVAPEHRDAGLGEVPGSSTISSTRSQHVPAATRSSDCSPRTARDRCTGGLASPATP